MSRGNPLRRNVAGLTLQRTFGRRYVSVIAGKTVVFCPVLRDSGSVRCWESFYDRVNDENLVVAGGAMTFGLADCVIATQHQIINDIRHEKGIKE